MQAASKLNLSLFSSNRILKRIIAPPAAATISFKPHLFPHNKQLHSAHKHYFSKAKPSGFSTRIATEAPEGDVVINPDGTLAVSREWGLIAEFDDKYDLRKVKTAKRLLTLLKQGNYNYSLNDLIFFLKRLVELNDVMKLSMDVQNMADFNIFVRKIKEKLKEDNEKYPWIGSYAWCFWKLGYNNDKELWKMLAEYVLEDKYYPVLKEATYAMEGFSMLNTVTDQGHIDKVYEKLERTCILTIWEVNMTYYKRIAESLVRVNRFTPHVFARIEQHVLANLTMEYELNTITDILFAFAVSGNGSKEFYNAVQFVMVKGHMFNRMAPFHMLWNDNPKHGAFVAKLIHTYSIVKEKVPELQFEPDFTALTYKLATNDRVRYNLEELVTVMEHIEVFQFEEIKEINKLLDSKLFQIEENMYANDMIRYIDAKVRRDYGGDYTQLPEKILTFFDNYVLKNLDSQGPGRVYYYLAESEVRGLLHGKEELVATVIKKMGKNIQQYDFEKVCYMYWFATRYGFMLEDKQQDLKLTLDMFKDYIRLYRVMGKDKMELGTNYYKMLEVFNEGDLSKKEETVEGK